MPLWQCDWPECFAAAVQRGGDCVLCDKHLCRTHLQDPWHTCPKATENWSEYSSQYVAAESRRLDRLCRSIDVEKLCARASQVRPGGTTVPCSVELSQKCLLSMMGGQNCHSEVLFEDGLVWVVRFRVPSPISPPQDVRDYVLCSEAATLEFLQNHTSIPSPHVYDWACESDPANDVGVGYILMEKIQGTPLDWPNTTTAQRESVVRQLADIMLELERHPFDALGSLVTGSGGRVSPQTARNPRPLIRGLAQPSMFRPDAHSRPLGPFRSSRDAFHALVNAHLRMIADGEIGCAENAIDLFLAHRFRLEVMDEAWAPTIEAHGIKEAFYLKHPDDKGDHIFVNADFDIVGIIDWEWCCTASKEEAFSSPCMMWPVAAFYDGSNELAVEELLLANVFRGKGRNDLAECVLNGRKVQRLFFALGPSGQSSEHKETFVRLFMGLKRAFDTGNRDGEDAKQGQDMSEWEAWKVKALSQWGQEELLQATLASV